MGKPSEEENPTLHTLECLNGCKKLFAILLDAQAKIYKKRRRSKTLTDRDVIDAYDTLVTGTRPHIAALLLSHSCEILGGGLTAFGWIYQEAHEKDSFASWGLILAGIFLLVAGVSIREFFAKK